MSMLVLDFETKDPHLGLEIGPGWCYPKSIIEFKTVGYSYCWIDGDNISPSSYHRTDEKGITELEDILRRATYVIMHNAPYDLGCIQWLNIDISRLRVLDTKIIAKLYDSTRYSYKLDPLLKDYFGDCKYKNRLIDVIEKFNLCPKLKPTNKTYAKACEKWAYENMDILQDLDFQAMSDYANQDTQGTSKLLIHLLKGVSLAQAEYYSSFQVITNLIRSRGQPINMAAISEGIELLTPQDKALEQQLYKLFGEEFNLNSNPQLTVRMKAKGYDIPKTQIGGDSIPKEWLELMEGDELCDTLHEYRSTHKILNDFFLKPLNTQQYSCPEALNGAPVGRVFSELNVLGAAATGRFSSSCPNIQQIPNPEKALGKLCRSIFITEDPDKKWISADFSNQEGRLQVEYAHRINASGSEDLMQQFKMNPNVDMHQHIADMAKITRKQAKVINLGLSYGMGIPKLAKALKCSKEQAQAMKDNYNRYMPYLSTLAKACQRNIAKNGVIRTIGGRNLHRESAILNGKKINFDYKAINKLIQGSAADQCYAALKICYDEGLTIRNVVHDEINIEGDLADAKKLKDIMEHCIQTTIPMVAEVSMGTNWGNLEDIEL